MELVFSPCGDNINDLNHHQSPTAEYDKVGRSCPSSTIKFANLAVFACQPLFVETCRMAKVPHDVDLVIYELSANEDPFSLPLLEGYQHQATERILRYCLGLPSKPAFVFLNLTHTTMRLFKLKKHSGICSVYFPAPMQAPPAPVRKKSCGQEKAGDSDPGQKTPTQSWQHTMALYSLFLCDQCGIILLWLTQSDPLRSSVMAYIFQLLGPNSTAMCLSIL